MFLPLQHAVKRRKSMAPYSSTLYEPIILVAKAKADSVFQ